MNKTKENNLVERLLAVIYYLRYEYGVELADEITIYAFREIDFEKMPSKYRDIIEEAEKKIKAM